MFVLTPSSPALVRRAGTQSLNRAVDRLFNESLDRVFGGDAADAAVRTPAMDVSESDTAYTVVLDVPGASKEQLQVSVQGRRVSVQTSVQSSVQSEAPAATQGSTETAAATTADTQRVLYRERGLPRYARTISLPAEVDDTASQAKFEHGVLTLTLGKRVPTGSRTLTVL